MTPRTLEEDDSPLAPEVDPDAPSEPVPPDAAEPDLGRTGRAVTGERGRSVATTVLAVLAVLYSLYFAREFLRPLAFALLLSFLFSPAVRVLARARLRPPVGAALVVLALLAGAGVAVYELAVPVQSWAAKAPATVAATQRKLRRVLQPLQRVSRTTEQVANSASTATSGDAGATQEVVVRRESYFSRFFGTTQRLLAAALEVIILLYFLLAGGDLFLQKLVKVLPDPRGKAAAIEVARATEASISTYLLTAASVNIAEGLVVTAAMYLLGMPSPALWGVLVAVLEFVPYLGALTMVVVLSVAALTTFSSVGHALLVPAAFLAINLVQANLVSPLLLGHRLELNPVALLVGVAFWFWIWGVPGAFIAVPLMAAFKIVCDHVPSLAAVGEFLGTRDEQERRAILR